MNLFRRRIPHARFHELWVQRHNAKRQAELLAVGIAWQLQWQIQLVTIQFEYNRALDKRKIEHAKWQAKQARDDAEFYAKLYRVNPEPLTP